jgi:hypothetical protein
MSAPLPVLIDRVQHENAGHIKTVPLLPVYYGCLLGGFLIYCSNNLIKGDIRDAIGHTLNLGTMPNASVQNLRGLFFSLARGRREKAKN